MSHEHLDHRGGLNAIVQAWPNLVIRSSLNLRGHLLAAEGKPGAGEGFDFRRFGRCLQASIRETMVPAWLGSMTAGVAFCLPVISKYLPNSK